MFQSGIVVARASGRPTEGVVAAIVGRKLVLIAAESTWVARRQLIPPLPVRRVRSRGPRRRQKQSSLGRT